MSGFTKFEAAVLEEICALNPDVADVLRRQIATARVTDRSNTGGGFFTDIEVNSDAPELPHAALVDDVKVDVVGLPAPGLGFVIYAKEGRLTCLEGFLWGDGDTGILDLTNLMFTLRPPD